MKTFNINYHIKSFDVDMAKKLKISKLFHLFQEVAYQHASILNFGYQDLKEKNLFWVLARVNVKFHNFPVWNDDIKIKTWHKGGQRLFAYRDFQIFKKSGERLIDATSSWLIVDVRAKRPVRIKNYLDNASAQKEKNALDKELNRINIPDKIKKVGTGSISYSDIDLNNHVNNAKYIEWMMDHIDIDILLNRSITNLSVNFLKETKFNDKLSIYQTRSKNIIYSLFKKNEKDIFHAKLALKE